MTFQDDITRMLADAYADLDSGVLGEAFGGPKAEPQPTITVTVTKSSAYLMLSVNQQLDAGLITEEQARAQGWTPYVLPPVSWRHRMRFRWWEWRERVGRRVGGWLAGVDLSERDEDW